MNFLFYQLYLLQLENYEIYRYFQTLFRKGYFRPSVPLRKNKITWTGKVSGILVISILIVLVAFFLLLKLSIIISILWFVLSLLIFPIFYIISLCILYPFDAIAKKNVMSSAGKLIAGNKKLMIIGIAGSYGKTTMKNVLSSVLAEKFQIQPTPGNVNTPVGIASWYRKNHKNNTDYLLIEFGEEYPGDNAKTAKIFPPDFVIITGINEAHFERLKNIETTAAAIFESVKFAKPNAKAFLNSDDQNIMKYYEIFSDKKEITFYGKKDVKNSEFDSDKLQWKAEIADFGPVSTSVLGQYVLSDIDAVIKLAKSLGLTSSEIKNGLNKIVPIKHRLEPIAGANDVLVIDDTYNGNPEGIKEAINLLARFKNKRKIYFTPGMAEAGSKNQEVHQEIGKRLADVADKVILIKSRATPFIAEGLKMKNFPEENIFWFNSTPEAQESLGKILKSNDVILFQNDWGDLYL